MTGLLFVFAFLIASPSWADETQLQGGVSGQGSVSSSATATGDEFYRETECGRALLRVSGAGVHGVGSFLGFTAQAEGQSAGAYMYSSGEAYFVPFSEMQQDGYPESPEYRFIFDHLSTEADQTVYIRSQVKTLTPLSLKSMMSFWPTRAFHSWRAARSHHRITWLNDSCFQL
jgi:hypothetical protein